MKILFVTPYLPSPPRSGGARRMHALIGGLSARGHETHVLSLTSPDEDVAVLLSATRQTSASATAVQSPAWAASRRQKRLLQLRSLFSPRSFEWHQHRYRPFQQQLDEKLGERFDVVNVEFSQMACFDYSAARDALLVVDEHNVEYDIVRRTAAQDPDLLRKAYSAVNWRKLRREERRAWRSFDGLVFTSRRDQELVLADAPGARTAVVPNGVDVEQFDPAAPGLPAPEPGTVLFFGALNYYPNEDGLIFFLDAVWPLLRRAMPGVKLWIVGQHPPASLLQRGQEGITITGRVDDLRPWLSRAGCVIAPLRIGGGTRLKILEAMAMARPVISTRIGAEGLDVQDGEQLLLADEPQAFSDAIVRTLCEPALARSLSAAARRLAVDRYAWPAAVSVLEQFYQSL